YHLHDPELLPFAVLLRSSGRAVIYDAHEDVPTQVLGKPWIPKAMRRAVARFSDVVERGLARRVTAVITADDRLVERFRTVAPRVVAINNYALEPEAQVSVSWPTRGRQVAYVGSITE